MADTSRARAWQVLQESLCEVDSGPDPPDAVVGAWVDGDDVICIIVEKEGCPTIGLRRQLEPDLPVSVLAAYIAESELGEPLGALWDEAVPDEHGVHWFAGDHPEWRDYSALMPRQEHS